MTAAGGPAHDPAAITRRELLTPAPAQALAGLLDLDLPSARELPPLWHWVYLLDRPRQAELGADGHPTRGVPAPPEPGVRRMFAGGRVSLRSPMAFDVETTRTTRLLRTGRKQGRQGPLTFVTVRHEWLQHGEVAIVDEQDLVYRAGRHQPVPEPQRGSSEAGGPVPPDAGPSLRFAVDPVVLFRFSALTYNAHRIHYDRSYAAEEGYPDLVVHGPLQALLMGELLRRGGADLVGRTFAYRLVAPAFGAQTLTATASTATKAELWSGYGQVTAEGCVLEG